MATHAQGRRVGQSGRYSDHVPARSDILVEHLEANGGIVYAMSNTPEFGAGANTFNEVFGATLNLLQRGRFPSKHRASGAHADIKNRSDPERARPDGAQCRRRGAAARRDGGRACGRSAVAAEAGENLPRRHALRLEAAARRLLG